jgi:hypothetical protein
VQGRRDGNGAWGRQGVVEVAGGVVDGEVGKYVVPDLVAEFAGEA